MRPPHRHLVRLREVPKDAMNQPTWGESYVAMGGLMRCCLDTLAKVIEEAPETPCVEGQSIQCRYTSDPLHHMVMHNKDEIGTWKWDRPHA